MADLLTALDVERLALAAGKSMAAVCREAGVAHTTFGRWKNGKTEPTLDVYRRLVKAAGSHAGVSPDDMVAPEGVAGVVVGGCR